MGRNTAWGWILSPSDDSNFTSTISSRPQETYGKCPVHSLVVSRTSNEKVLRIKAFPWRAPEVAEWLKIGLCPGFQTQVSCRGASIGPTKLVASWQLNHLNTFFTGVARVVSASSLLNTPAEGSLISLISKSFSTSFWMRDTSQSNKTSTRPEARSDFSKGMPRSLEDQSVEVVCKQNMLWPQDIRLRLHTCHLLRTTGKKIRDNSIETHSQLPKHRTQSSSQPQRADARHARSNFP